MEHNSLWNAGAEKELSGKDIFVSELFKINRNYDDVNTTSPDPLPSIYPRAIATSGTSATWNFTAWVPDALVINLGTNDFSTTPNPDETTFTTGSF